MKEPEHSGERQQRASSCDEWSRLREVVVGHADFYDSHHVDSTFRLFYHDNVRPESSLRFVNIPEQFLRELEEDLEGLASALRSAGVRVLRPAPLKVRAEITSPYWRSTETPPLNVRDQSIVLGDTIVETAPHQRARYFENDYLKPIFYQYFRAGSPWLSMPRPTLGRHALDDSFFGTETAGIDYNDAEGVDCLGHELVFDGAQCIRLGRDVLVNVANANHRLGLEWLRRQFDGVIRFWELDGLADSHIDSLVMPLRPGLLLLRSPDVLRYLPPALQRWDILVPPPLSDDNFPDYSEFGFNLASKYIDTNVLSVDPNTVIVNSLCPELCELLESRGFHVLRVRHRHRRLYNGGFHCFTLDTVRDGELDCYL